MEQNVLSYISSHTGISARQIEATAKLLDGGATIPFISRYRKEATGSLDETQIQAIATAYEEARDLEKRRAFIIETIEAQGKMTDNLKAKIGAAADSASLEDLYLPYKQKRRTRAEIARQKGLEPLARIIIEQRHGNIHKAATSYVGNDVADGDEAIAGALDIVAEWVSEDKAVRQSVRSSFEREAVITAKVVKGKEEAAANFRNYFDFTSPLRRCGSHQLLAIRRGEREGLLKVDISIDTDRMTSRISRQLIKTHTEASRLMEQAIADSYKRLIKPSIENEFAASSKDAADASAIDMFAGNVRQLLYAPPLGRKRVLAIDPGYRTGCKVVCLDEQGNLLHNDVIYPTPPRSETAMAAKKLQTMIESYRIDAIALGNGTASRETERFLESLRCSRDVKVFVVSEDGASVYSASKVARDEFPDKDVTVRGAVSIGRRLLDPLAELVKIEPRSIGVGQYQHDVNQTRLKKALGFTVESCVNSVGVNLNTASRELLTYVSGVGPQLAQNIVDYRAANGDFHSRRELLRVPKLGPKAYEQCAGFLRIPDGDNPLDNTAVHPENYAVVKAMADGCHMTVAELIADKAAQLSIDLQLYASDTVGLPTLRDIMAELDKPGRDPRAAISVMKFDDALRSFDDVHEGMVVNGIVTNITQFGAFVDIGIKENGLIHISEMADHYVASPADVVSLHQQLRVKVKGVDTERRRISLTLKDIE